MACWGNKENYTVEEKPPGGISRSAGADGPEFHWNEPPFPSADDGERRTNQSVRLSCAPCIQSLPSGAIPWQIILELVFSIGGLVSRIVNFP